jgi:hypothetical protein
LHSDFGDKGRRTYRKRELLTVAVRWYIDPIIVRSTPRYLGTCIIESKMVTVLTFVFYPCRKDTIARISLGVFHFRWLVAAYC